MRHDGWIEHRRAGDRERLGWIRTDGKEFVAVDALGRDITGPVDWLTAEEALEDHGLHWLTDPWQLRLPDGSSTRVRIVELTPDRIVVKTDDFGAGDAALRSYVLPFPAPTSLQRVAEDASTVATRSGGA
jgi:hypothetical protein